LEDISECYLEGKSHLVKVVPHVKYEPSDKAVLECFTTELPGLHSEKNHSKNAVSERSYLACRIAFTGYF